MTLNYKSMFCACQIKNQLMANSDKFLSAFWQCCCREVKIVPKVFKVLEVLKME